METMANNNLGQRSPEGRKGCLVLGLRSTFMVISWQGLERAGTMKPLMDFWEVGLSFLTAWPPFFHEIPDVSACVFGPMYP